MLFTVESEKNLEETLDSFQAAIKQQGFGVLGVHNLTGKMKEKGVDFNRECRVVEVCNPHQAKTVLESNMDISVALPCRVSIFTEGAKTRLATIQPKVLLSMFPNPELKEAAEEVERAITSAMKAAAE